VAKKKTKTQKKQELKEQTVKVTPQNFASVFNIVFNERKEVASR